MVTRHEPTDGPQPRLSLCCANLFSEEVLAATMWKIDCNRQCGAHQAIALRGHREGSSRRAAYDRAIEALEAVNGEIRGLILGLGGRCGMAREKPPTALRDELFAAANSAMARHAACRTTIGAAAGRSGPWRSMERISAEIERGRRLLRARVAGSERWSKSTQRS